MSYDIITSLNDFKPLQTVYNELLEDLRNRHGCYTPQLSHEWLATYWEYLAGDAKVEVLVHKDKTGKIVGFSPFMTKRLPGIRGQLGLTQLTFLADDKTDCSDFILSEPHRQSILQSEILPFIERKKQSASRICLRKFRPQSPSWKALKCKWNHHFMPVTENPIANLGTDPDRYFALVGKKTRYQYRKAWKDLCSNENKVSLEYYNNLSQETLFLMAEMDTERASTTSRRTAISRNDVRSFFVSVMPKLSARNEFAGWLLKIGDVVIAYRIGFLVGGATFQGWQTSYNLQYDNYTPGKILTGKAIEDCFKRGITRFDTLNGGEVYKASWCDQIDILYAYEWQANPFRSRLVEAGGAMKRLVFP